MSEQARERAERRVVVAGAGMAGVQTAVALREQGFTGPVTVIGAEPHQPYDRPPLSKAVLLGKAEGSAFDIDFEALGIGLRLGREVLGVRPADHELDTAEGPVPYDVLVLATGAEPVRLPGTEGVPGVHLLRTLDSRPASSASTPSGGTSIAATATSCARLSAACSEPVARRCRATLTAPVHA